MEAQETDNPSPLPTGKSVLVAAVCLCVGVGLIVLSILADRAAGTVQSFLGPAGLLAVYVLPPLLGLFGISSALGRWSHLKTSAIAGQKPARTTARAFLIASPLFAGLSLVPVLLGILRGVPLHLMLLPWWIILHAAIALLGLAMAWIALRLYRRMPNAKPSRAFAASAVVFALASIAGVFSLSPLSSYLSQSLYDRTRVPTFAGDSSQLEQTAVVPTLDTPSPPGRNVIWCSSFQLAWNEIRDHVIGAPLQVMDAQPLADRLNNGLHRASDLEPRSVYAAGGWTHKGIIDRIEKDVTARFPKRQLPDFSAHHGTGGILAYSYLTAHVPFEHPFRPIDEGVTFTDSQGAETHVAGFGLWQAFLSRYESIREQVEVLYVLPEEPEHFWGTKEYALDLCRHTRPYQVVIAAVEPKASLAETYDHVQRGIEHFRNQPNYDHHRWFHDSDELEVPDVFCRIDHRFTELIGKLVANVGMPIVEALQTIEFRLDRSGALLESEALVDISALPREFLFNRPFLIYMKKRDADRPFFVLWVDNAELLTRR